MADKNLPHIPLYIGDWEKDCNVLSLETEAAWLRVIFKMFTNGKQSTYKIPTKGLQNLWKCSEQKAAEIIQELKDYNICEIVEIERFVEFKSRRFERENVISEKRKQAVSLRKDRTKDLQASYKGSTNGVQNHDNDIDNDNDNNNEIECRKNGQKKPKYPYELIKQKFNEICSHLPSVTALSESRKSNINGCLDLAKPEDVESFITGYFQKVAASNFLNGQNGKNWKAGFDFIFKNSNFIKINEGNYDNPTGGTNTPVVRHERVRDRARELEGLGDLIKPNI